MRRVVVYPIAVLAAALAACGIGPVLAETAGGSAALAETVPAETEGEGPALPETRSDAATLAHLLLFSGADVWRNGAFMHGGFLYAYQGLNQDGPVFKLLLNGGLYRFDSAGSEIAGRQVMAAAPPGLRRDPPRL